MQGSLISLVSRAPPGPQRAELYLCMCADSECASLLSAVRAIQRLFDRTVSMSAMKQNTFIKNREVSSAVRRLLLLIVALAAAVLFASEVDLIARGQIPFAYELGNGLTNYSAGFVRRGLFGEIIQLMSVFFQPAVSIILLSAAANLFILCIILKRMGRLNVSLPFILAIVFSPSLILMHRGEEFMRIDAIILALNFAASCLLLHLISQGNGPSARLRRAGTPLARMLALDAVLFSLLTAAALIHELSATLLPPVMLLFFVYARRCRRTTHFAVLSVLLLAVYSVMMKSFSFADSDVIADSWAGIYTNPDSFRYSDGLISIVDRVRALDCKKVAMDRLTEGGMRLFADMIIAVVLPLAVVLLSGIRIFHSASWHSRIVRCLIFVFSMAPLGLCLVAYDFGRWFSLCAINLTVYCLLISHPAPGAVTSAKSASIDRKITGAVMQCALLAVAIVLLSFRLNWDGKIYQGAPNIWVYIKESAHNTGNLAMDIRPLLTREKIYQPKNLWKFPPWRQDPAGSSWEGQQPGAGVPAVVLKPD